MRSTFSILPYINRNKVKADGTTSVLCRITIDGKSSTMATGIYCSPEDWNSRTGTISEPSARTTACRSSASQLGLLMMSC